MKIAYTGWTWIEGGDRDASVRQLESSFRELKYLGYDYCENFAFIADFFTDPSELVKIQEKYGIRLINLYGNFDFDIASSVERSKKQIDFLAAIGGTHFNCQNSGFGDGGPAERETDENMVGITAKTANELGRYAKSKGITLCLHPHYGTCIFTGSDIDAFAELTDPEYVSLCIDTAQTRIAGMDPAGTIRKYAGRIGYIHLKDVDENALENAKGCDKMKTFRALGEGNISFTAVKDALGEIGYDGYLCVELDNPRIRNYQSAETSRKYIKTVLGL